MALARAVIGIAFLFFCGPAGASPERRLALVIGIDRYDNLPAGSNLKKAVGDARAVASALKSLGFEVETGENVSRSEFNRLWARFTAKLAPGDVAAFHFSGHGVELSGANYLIPRDVPDLSEAGEQLLRDESIGLNRLLDDLREKHPRVSFLIVDACRANPFADRRGRSACATRGLGRAEPPKGSFVMYSAGTGQEALDRLSEADADPNSVYTRALLPLLTAPGLSLSDIAKKVKGGVRDLAALAGRDQTPAYYDEIIGDFYPAGERPAPSEAKPQAQAPLSEAAQAWAGIKELGDIAVFEAFRKQYGAANPLYDTLARQRIAMLQRKQAVPSKQAHPDGEPPSSWWPWSGNAKPEGPGYAPAQPGGTQSAVNVPKAPSPVRPADDACDDGLLVSVGLSNKRPCIKPGSGESFQDCANCPEMVVVPAGSFVMGSPESEPERTSYEGPQHRVTITKPFAVGKFAVTFAEWDACVAGGGCGGHIPDDRGWGRGGRPVIYVSWDNAKAYLKWLSKKTGKEYRLLSEAEREYAARAGTQTPFWWGSWITPDQANYAGDEEPYQGGGQKGEDRQKTQPVKSFQPNPWGLYQVHGNVGEWVEDCWNETYNGAPTDGSALDNRRSWPPGFSQRFVEQQSEAPPRGLPQLGRHGVP